MEKITNKNSDMVIKFVMKEAKHKTTTSVRDELNAYLDNELPKFTTDEICRIIAKGYRDNSRKYINELTLEEFIAKIKEHIEDENCYLGKDKGVEYLIKNYEICSIVVKDGKEVIQNNIKVFLRGAWGLSAYLFIVCGKFITGDEIIKFYRKCGFDIISGGKEKIIEFCGPRYLEQLNKRKRGTKELMDELEKETNKMKDLVKNSQKERGIVKEPDQLSLEDMDSIVITSITTITKMK